MPSEGLTKYGRQRSLSVNKVADTSWEANSAETRPPMPQDQRSSVPARPKGFAVYGPEASGSRSTKAPTLSNMPTSRVLSSRQGTERGVSLSVSQLRGPSTSSSKFFLTVIPPVDLPHDPPHPRNQASTSSGSHVRRGTLLPLFPTLGGQLYAISREYGLPTIGGISLYLCDDGEGNLGPRVGDAAWSALWARFFDESAEILYDDLTSPRPARRIYQSHDSGDFSDMQSPFADLPPTGLQRDTGAFGEDSSFEVRRPSSSFMKASHANGFPASPMAYHTPSPRHAKASRPTSRSSLHNSAFTAQVRLPIVGRVEWAVDKNRAPWWNNWVSEAECSADRAAPSSVRKSQVMSSRRDPPRRSMHLTSSFGQYRAESPLRSSASVLAQDSMPSHRAGRAYDERDTAREEASGSVERIAASSNSLTADHAELSAMGYEPIADEDAGQLGHRDHIESSSPAADPQSEGNAVGASYDSQSYAGYSQLLGVDEEAQRASMLTSASSLQRGAESVSPIEGHFNSNLLSGAEEDDWREMNQRASGSIRAAKADRLSASSIKAQSDDYYCRPQMEPAASAAVHEWISKTQSPQVGLPDLDLEEHVDRENDVEEEEQLLPPQDDVEEVIGLWADKTRQSESSVLPMEPTAAAGPASMSLSQKKANSVAHSSAASFHKSLTLKRRSTDSSSLDQQQQQQDGLDDAGERDMPLNSEPPPTASLAAQSTKISKAALLSPIALEGSSAVFAGPSPDLGSLLTGRTNLAPYDQHRGMMSREDTMTSTATSTSETVGRLPSDHSYMLASPRLEVPSPRSPGGLSRRSSSTDVSDTLRDMERALALLSPAVSNNNQDSPAMGMSTTDTTFDSLSATRGGRFTSISSKESMARARTLSTSVTPSPRWFRNTTPAAMPVLPTTPSGAIDRVRSTSQVDDADGRRGADDGPSIMLRPASASASSRHIPRTPDWDLQRPLLSASRLRESMIGDSRDDLVEGNASRFEARPIGEKGEVQPPQNEEADDNPILALDALIEVRSKNDSPLDQHQAIGEDPSEDTTWPQSSTSASHSERHDSVIIYDSPVDVDERVWRPSDFELSHQSEEQSPRVDDRSTAVPISSRTVEEQIASANPSNLIAESAASVHPSFSPRSGQYATVGVQAEREDGSRTDSMFSLVSESETEGTMTEEGSFQEEETAGEQQRSNMAVSDLGSNYAHHDATSLLDLEPGATPKIKQEPGVSHQPSQGPQQQSSDEVQPSIQRLIRGYSFAESSEAASSQAPSPFVPQESHHLLGESHFGAVLESQNIDWDHFDLVRPGMMSERALDKSPVTNRNTLPSVSGLNTTDSVQGDDATMRGDAHTNPTSSRSDGAEEWSQDGSEYDEEEEGLATGSPATKGFPDAGFPYYSIGAGASDAGGRTPTFFYDQHLIDDEAGSQRGSKRFSGSRRGSRNQQRQSKPPAVRGSGMEDALGVGLWPTNSATIVTDSEHGGFSTSNSTYDMSVDSHRHDVISLQGEMLGSNDDRMLSGFEPVGEHSRASLADVPQQQQQQDQLAHRLNEENIYESRQEDGASTVGSAIDSAKLQQLSTFAASATHLSDERASTPNVSTPTVKHSEWGNSAKEVPSLALDRAGSTLRRSMGSITEDRSDHARGSWGRRASASAMSPSKAAAVAATSPRRFRGMLLRLGNHVDGHGSSSSRGSSPNQRFRALPPSPSLPASGGYGAGGDLVSPTSLHFARTNTASPPPVTFMKRLVTSSTSWSKLSSANSENDIRIGSRSSSNGGLNGFDRANSSNEGSTPSPNFRSRRSGSMTPTSPRGPRPPPMSPNPAME